MKSRCCYVRRDRGLKTHQAPAPPNRVQNVCRQEWSTQSQGSLNSSRIVRNCSAGHERVSFRRPSLQIFYPSVHSGNPSLSIAPVPLPGAGVLGNAGPKNPRKGTGCDKRKSTCRSRQNTLPSEHLICKRHHRVMGAAGIKPHFGKDRSLLQRCRLSCAATAAIKKNTYSVTDISHYS